MKHFMRKDIFLNSSETPREPRPGPKWKPPKKRPQGEPYPQGTFKGKPSSVPLRDLLLGETLQGKPPRETPLCWELPLKLYIPILIMGSFRLFMPCIL